MTRRAWTIVVAGASLLLAIASVSAQDHAPTSPSGTTAAPAPSAELTRPTVAAWAPESGRDCHVFHGRRMCEGPRRVPLLAGEALRRAEALDLVGPRVARAATTSAAPASWIAAAREGGAQSSPDLLWPVPEGRLWRGFGPRQGFRRTRRGLVRTRRRHMHQGVDIGAREGSLIVAVNDGLVAYSDNRMSGYGNAVLIVHADGAVTMYAHCMETYVVAGQNVRRGEVIAAVGQTGIAHGAHLHFEYRREGRLLDPQPLFTNIPDLPPLARRPHDIDTRVPPAASDAPTEVEVVPTEPSTSTPSEPAETPHAEEP